LNKFLGDHCHFGYITKLTKRKKERKSCGSFNGDFSPNFDLKNKILTYTKNKLMGKENGPNSPDFELKKFQISPESYESFQKAAKNIEGLCVF
jgi:hypothetical protein